MYSNTMVALGYAGQALLAPKCLDLSPRPPQIRSPDRRRLGRVKCGCRSLYCSCPSPGERASARQQVASLETAIAARSPCEPKDAALGSSSGDPYTFYSFNREDELSRSREACLALASAEPTKP